MTSTTAYVRWRRAGGTTLDGLIDEMTTIMLVEHDAEKRFRLRAARCAAQTQRGIELLAKAMKK